MPLHTLLLSHYVYAQPSPSFLHDFTNVLFIIQTCKLLQKYFPVAKVYTCKTASHMIFIIVRNGKVNLLICSFGAKVRVEYVFPTFYNNNIFFPWLETTIRQNLHSCL